jgi:hypothetical protein
MSSKARRTAAAAILASVALLSGVRGSAVVGWAASTSVVVDDPDRVALDLDEYERLVTAYRSGDADAPKRVAVWMPRRLAVVAMVIAKSRGGHVSWNTPRLAAAAMLHTDAARVMMESNDRDGVSLHLDLAGRLLECGAPSLNRLASRWYVVVARVLRDRVWLAHADALLHSGRQRLPHDAAVLCESGTLAELLATDRQVSVRAGPLLQPGSDFVIEQFQRRRAADLVRASRWLQEGVEAGSVDVLCQLHLGRVRALLGDDRAARSALRLLQSGPDVAVGYLASMFLGAVAERRNERDEAERCYRAALARFDGGQSAQVALGAILFASGRGSEARALIGRSMDRGQNTRREPWWWYHFEPGDLVEGNYEVLRREALQ